jgi:hypothetical protein
MRTGQHNSPHPDESGIPEFESPQHAPGVADSLDEMGKGIVNAFTIDRDTNLADGAGAPGSTDVGGMAKEGPQSKGKAQE